MVAIREGLRQGEILALRWSDVDLEARHHHGSQVAPGCGSPGHPKSRKTSRRSVVPLFDETIDALRAHRTRQVEERLLAGTIWQDADLVFPNEFGAFQSTTAPPGSAQSDPPIAPAFPGSPLSRFAAQRRDQLALKGDMHPKVASERLGHASVAITLDLYSHVTATMQREAVEAITRKRSAKRDLLGAPR